MTDVRQQRPDRRPGALTKTSIVESAIGLLDAGGIEALTYRALAADLATGAGALYHHVSNKSELLAAAAAAMMTDVLGPAGSADPAASIRGVTIGVFDAISAHPWWGTQLVSAPWQPAVLALFDRIGSEVTALGVQEQSQFNATSALVHHVLGVASQYDAGLKLAGTVMSRPALLESATSPLVASDAGLYPFLRRISRELVEHDDRDQFQAGIEIILTGIEALRSTRHDHESIRTVEP